jgi:uncharacterized protein (DUF1778 family)
LAGRREARVNVRLSPAEYADVLAAARASGLTPSGFAAEAIVAASRHETLTRGDHELIRELMSARSQLRRYGNNVNQAARVLNASGEPPEWLERAIALSNQTVENIDRTVQGLRRQSVQQP